MTDTRRIEDLSADELFSIAAKKLAVEGESLTDIELRLEAASRGLMGSELLRQLEQPEGKSSKKCPSCGKRCGIRAHKKTRTLRTLGGEIRYQRNYHYCDGCQEGFYPRDLALDIPESGELSAEVERRVVDFGINDPDAQAATRFSMHYSQSISSNQVRKALARTGNRMENSNDEWLEEALRAPETTQPDALIVQTDGSMVSTVGGWKEVKLGVIHAQQKVSASPDATPCHHNELHSRYVCRLGSQQDFEDALEEAITAHSIDRPAQIVWLGDGAPGYWAVCQRLAPNAVEILDWYHAIEHAVECAKALFASSGLVSLYIKRIKSLLWNGKVDALLEELQGCLFLAESDAQRSAIHDLIRYYKTNAHRLNYPKCRSNGWPIGSGRVESAHKHVIQQRMKRAGQHWSLPRAKTMVRLRAAYSTAGAKNFYEAISKARKKSKAA